MNITKMFLVQQESLLKKWQLEISGLLKAKKRSYKVSLLRKIFLPLLALLVPLVGVILFELDWSGFDFLVMALLILSFSILINLILYNLNSAKLKLLLLVVLVILFLLIWAELAVGIFGTPFAGS